MNLKNPHQLKHSSIGSADEICDKFLMNHFFEADPSINGEALCDSRFTTKPELSDKSEYFTKYFTQVGSTVTYSPGKVSDRMTFDMF